LLTNVTAVRRASIGVRDAILRTAATPRLLRQRTGACVACRCARTPIELLGDAHASIVLLQRGSCNPNSSSATSGAQVDAHSRGQLRFLKSTSASMRRLAAAARGRA
jgi:hypothetical protein